MRFHYHSMLCSGVVLAALATIVAGRCPTRCLAQEMGTSDELIAVLQSEDSDLHAKAVACKKLAAVGGAEAVPVLAELLDDPQLSHYARFGLEPNPAPAAGEALIAALDRVEGRLLAGMINSLGVRKEAGAIDKLAALGRSDDPQIVSAVAHAMGQIANAESAAVLKEMLAADSQSTRNAAADGALMCADNLADQGNTELATEMYDAVRNADVATYCRVAAVQGAIVTRGDEGVELLAEQLAAEAPDFFRVGLSAARLVGSDAAAEAIKSQLAEASGSRAVALLATLAEISPDAALPAARETARSGAKENRIDALRVLSEIGQPEDLPILLEAAQSDDPDIAEAGYNALTDLRGEEVDRAIIAGLQQAEGPTRILLLQAAGDRYLVAAGDAVLALLDSSDAATRQAAISAAGTTIELGQLSQLVAELTGAVDDAERKLIQESLRNAVRRMPDPEQCADVLVESMADASTQAKIDILELLANVGGETALAAVAEAANSQDDAMRDAGTRILGEWMSPKAADELLAIAKDDPTGRYGIRCLRGYIRIARQLNVSNQERLTMCRRALEVAQRQAERQLVLDVLERNPSPGSLALAVEMLEYSEMVDKTAAAAIAIGKEIVDSAPDAVRAAMDAVQAATGDADLINQAKELQEQAQ